MNEAGDGVVPDADGVLAIAVFCDFAAPAAAIAIAIVCDFAAPVADKAVRSLAPV